MYKLKSLAMSLVAVLLLVAVTAVVNGSISLAQASTCSTVGTYTSCYDHKSGNSYSTNRYENQSFTYGNNAKTGTTWNQNTITHGNQSFTYGQSSKGATWNSNTLKLGNQSITNGYSNQKGAYRYTTPCYSNC